MKIITILVQLTILFLFCIIPNVTAGEIMYARYPALSPDGATIAFTYMGDIWTVPSTGGDARRLTIHQAEDIRPHFSPDGKTILFSSRRYNNYDLFVIPVDGGQTKQLTFHSATDYGTGWFPGGDSVLFYSNREWGRDIYKISIDGGMPIMLTGYPYEREFGGRISADSRYLLYTRGSGLVRWWRRDLRTTGNSDIFLQDRSKKEFTSLRLTDHPSHEIWPVFNQEKNEVYYVANYGDLPQVWKKSIDGGEAIQLTGFTGDGVQWLNSNPQSTMLIFEQKFQIWILNPDDGQLRQVPIFINSDERENLTTKRTLNSDVQRFSLSPDEKKIAAVVHGEIFVMPAEDPTEGKRITFTPTRERYPVWGNNSRTIYYCSDRGGNYSIYSADVTTGEETQLTNTDQDDLKPLVSPDGRYLVFYRGLDKIMRLDLSLRKESLWVEGNFFDLGVEPTREYDWSPDSKWLTFTQAGPTYETDIFVVPIEGKPVNVSRFAGWNYRPRFSADGKLIYFTSTLNDRYETYKIDLTSKPVEFFESTFDSLFMEQADKDKQENKDKEKTIEQVKIDFDRIENRRVKAYDLSGSSNYPVLTPDGEKYLFVASLLGEPEIWSINTGDELKLKQLTHSEKAKSQLTISSDSKYLFYLEEGKIKHLTIAEAKSKTLTFYVTLEINLLANNQQKFSETWRMLDSYFYDPTFHGADWEAAKLKYEPLLPHVRTEAEFGNLMMELMGELCASHLYFYKRQPEPAENITTSGIGLEFDYSAIETDGHFRITRVLPESPADFAGIRAGQYIKAVTGQPLSPALNLNKLLAGTIDHRLTVEISDDPDKRGRDIQLKPVSSGEIAYLTYTDWVETRRRMVDSLSEGRLAYLHIRAMNRTALDLFKQQLVSIAEPKDGMIVDVRDNGGGSIAVHLLGMLERTPFILRNFRSFPTTSENKMRSKAVEKPMVLLINNYSGSNSEIFAEGFRRLKLGKIIGEPTSGGVIGTSSYTLIDGTKVRRPSWGAYTTEMEDTDLHPRQPDIYVENLPDDLIAGRDPQLVRAVEELLQELK